MTVSVAKHHPVAPFAPLSTSPNMSRPQVGIERLPARWPTNEPRESMNCKSCRKRKIKCNRLRPACEACLVFRCACVYDAVPKKRGPKTDVLEALLKRVDGLEQKLKDQKKDGGSKSGEGTDPNAAGTGSDNGGSGSGSGNEFSPGPEQSPNASASAPPASATSGKATSTEQPTSSSNNTQGTTNKDDSSTDQDRHTLSKDSSDFTNTAMPDEALDPSFHEIRLIPTVQTDTLLHTYFTRSHAKPFHILDEASFRQRLQLDQIPSYLLRSVCALASRYTPHPGGYQAAVSLGEDYARQARLEVDTDEPSIDCLQALLLLALAFVASGKGKKAYMLLSNAIGMAVALELHRELDANAPIPPIEREMRRRLFWTCYLLDRFMACGSRRPSLVDDSTVLLRLPSWLPSPLSTPLEGSFFQSTSNLQILQGGGGTKLQGGSAMLIDISRILGITNRYLAAGGVKGDSHFPWHSLSNLSKIRHDLDAWAASAQDIFSSVETLFSQPDSTVLVMSKLIYHLIHCLVYRPFLPVDLAELSGTGQHQSWQIEATNLCFLHANAIAELTELGKRMPQIEWPGFVGYCICTAGTVHIHGVHYSKSASGGDMNVFAASAEFLSREMQHLAEMRHAWACVQHHRLTLQSIYNAHTELTKSVSSSPMRCSPVIQLEDFFDRYMNIGGPGGQSFNFDASNLILADVVVDFAPDALDGGTCVLHSNSGTSEAPTSAERLGLKRRRMAESLASTDNGLGNGHAHLPQSSQGLQSPTHQQSPLFSVDGGTQFSMGINGRISTGGRNSFVADRREFDVSSPAFSMRSHLGMQPQNQQRQQQQQGQQGQPKQHQMFPPSTSFSPLFNFSSPLVGHASTVTAQITSTGGTQNNSTNNNAASQNIELSGYDPMFASAITFSNPSPWHTVDEMDKDSTSLGAGGFRGNRQQQQHLPAREGMAGLQHHSPDGGPGTEKSVGGLGTGPGARGGEEKDPFLSLLEQLAENEYAQGPGSDWIFS